MTWLQVVDFKRIYGIEIDDDIVQQSIESAENTIIRTVFLTKETPFKETTSEQILCYPVMNITGSPDGSLTTSDVDIWEEKYEGQHVREYDLNDYKLSVINNHRQAILTTSTSVPTTTDRKAYAKYRIGREPTEDLIIELRRLEGLLAIDWLFTNVPFEKLQEGIRSWTLNGVSVDFDLDAIQKIMESNRKAESTLWNRLRLVRMDGVAPGRSFYDVNQRYLHGINWR